jgi:hypothetical protein
VVGEAADTAIRVVEERVGLAPSQIAITKASVTSCAVIAVHRPADNTPRVDDGSHIEPVFRCPDIREVSDPFADTRRKPRWFIMADNELALSLAECQKNTI